jgi:hypothetical protein
VRREKEPTIISAPTSTAADTSSAMRIELPELIDEIQADDDDNGRE